MPKYSVLDRSNENAKRILIEQRLQAGGLVQVAGGNRFRYFGLKTQGVDGYAIRTGIKAFRLVRRVRIEGRGLVDVSIGKEKFHGKVDLDAVEDWARKLVVNEFGAKPGLVQPAREVQIQSDTPEQA